MIKIDELMKIEKSLLEINENKAFELSFGDYIQLQNFLKEIGRITNYYFYLQEEFHRRHGDKDKLKEYHDRLKNDEIAYDAENVKEFIGRIEK